MLIPLLLLHICWSFIYVILHISWCIVLENSHFHSRHIIAFTLLSVLLFLDPTSQVSANRIFIFTLGYF